MKYRFCNYLLPCFNDSQNLLLYNTLYKNVTMIKKEDLKIFSDIRDQIINDGKYSGPKENITELVKNNILFEDGFDFAHSVDQIYENVIVNPRTLNLTILPTEKCNFRCVYCYEDFKKGKMSIDILKRIELLIEHLLPCYESLSISWFGGEPLLAMDVVNFISTKALSLCKHLKKPFCAQMTTNGYLLNVDIVKQLIKWHILTYQVTLDGSKTIHDKQRPLYDGSKTYDTILENLLQIKNNIKTNTIKFIIRINVSEDIDAANIKSVYELFGDDKRFIINPQHVFATERYQPLMNTFESYLEKIKSCGVAIQDSFLPEDAICYAAKHNSLMIRSDGSLGKCTVNFDDEKNNFGNILSVDLTSFNLKNLVYSNCQHSAEDCFTCPVYPICFGKQCPSRKKQPCAEILGKYSLLVRSLESKANCLILK